MHPKFEPRAGKIILWVVHAGSYPDGLPQRILFDTTAEILVAAAAHGTFNLHRIVHDGTPQSGGVLTPDNHKSSLRRAG
jgi:hypothetical protein